jgi:response regulator RpfG family c-di-GMP phosphodiesterase
MAIRSSRDRPDHPITDGHMNVTSPSDQQIVVADDGPAETSLLQRILLDAGYTGAQVICDPLQLVPTCLGLDPDLLLLDLHMSEFDGLAALERLAPLIRDEGSLPVIVAAGSLDGERRRRALALGARDFITKPLDAPEVLLRVRNSLATRSLQRRLAYESDHLAAVLAQHAAELSQAHTEPLHKLALVAEYRDDATNEHTRRVGRSAAAIGEAIGESSQMVRLLRAAAPLHDIGKIGLPDRVLLKPGRLTPGEFELMKAHTTIGASILAGSQMPELRLAETIALSHHERWNGRGYPRGLHGTDIHVGGRIVAVADVFDALVHPRPYKQAWPIGRALQEIASQRGRQFDPDVVEAFLALDHGQMAGLGGETASV